MIAAQGNVPSLNTSLPEVYRLYSKLVLVRLVFLRDRISRGSSVLKAGVNVKVLHGLSANISVTFQATLNLSAYLINHCLAVLCKFLGNFWAFWERIG